MSQRLLVLSRYSRLGASSRLRTLQYDPWLQDAGFEVEYAPFFDDAYLHGIYGVGGRNANVLRYYRHRLTRLLRGPRPSLIWVEKEALPWLPWMAENLLLSHSVPVVSDHDDAVFHRYDRHRLALVRRLLGRKIDRVMRRSALVTAGNPYLAARAHAAGAKNVQVVPTVVDLAHYQGVGTFDSDTPLRIGWIGSPHTWAEYMSPMMPSLTSIAASVGARITAVGAGNVTPQDAVLDVLPWTEDTEVERIRAMDIGIMPLTDTPWSRGKCGYKLIQYMACGLPVVASPVGVNTHIVEHGVNGFLAASDAEWRDALYKLARDPGLRQKMGTAGRLKVETDYSLAAWGPRVAAMLSHVVGGARP
tara:strand:+ start:82054 stop:83136 length:1083 start_codon:yes stop_codon:yes gene_type:complete